MPTLFSKIINGEIPCYKIAENENCIAFLDVFPLNKGHVLVIPKIEIDNIFDLTDEHFKELHVFSKYIANAIKKSFDCKKVGVAVVGLEVPHAHIHLIPINNVSDMNFANSKLSLTSEEMISIMNIIKSNL